MAYIEQEMTERATERFLEESRDEASMAWTQLIETEQEKFQRNKNTIPKKTK